MTSLFDMKFYSRARLVGQFLTMFALTTVIVGAHATEPDQSHLSAPAGDGWQMLSGTSAIKAVPTPGAMGQSPVLGASAVSPAVATPVTAPSKPMQLAMAQGTTDVTPVVLPVAPSTPNGILTFSITPQDTNLRNALDRWLQQQGWQLAWKIDDDLPLEFNATFTGDFKSVLTQVMQATNHMRTPTRVCKHTNNVVRVVARAANCQE